MSLTTLPTELHLELLSRLDYKSLINLTGTNRYFFSLRTDDLVEAALLLHEDIFETERVKVQEEVEEGDEDLSEYINWKLCCKIWEDMNFADGVLPCYGCLKLRKLASFNFLSRVRKSESESPSSQSLTLQQLLHLRSLASRVIQASIA
jgi:hypothetical protein